MRLEDNDMKWASEDMKEVNFSVIHVMRKESRRQKESLELVCFIELSNKLGWGQEELNY